MTGAELRPLLLALGELSALPRFAADGLLELGDGPMSLHELPDGRWLIGQHSTTISAGMLLAAVDRELEQRGLALEINEVPTRSLDYPSLRWVVQADVFRCGVLVTDPYGFAALATADVDLESRTPRIVAKARAALEAAVDALQALQRKEARA